jgi:hypothetical protein
MNTGFGKNSLTGRRMVMEWFSEDESVVKPVDFAPKDLGFIRLAIIVFIRRVHEWMKAVVSDKIIIEKEESVVGAKRFFATKEGLAVFHSYFGAPATIALAEALIAVGIKNILIFGEAGSISSKVNIGEIVIPTFAIREEGTSYHYLPPNFEAKPSDNLLKNIRGLLYKTGVPYKEGGRLDNRCTIQRNNEKGLNLLKGGSPCRGNGMLRHVLPINLQKDELCRITNHNRYFMGRHVETSLQRTKSY